MYLYSNILGTFVFNQHFRMREKVYFDKEEVLYAAPLLKEGKILPSEEVFLNRFKNIENLRETKDKEKIEKCLLVLSDHIKYRNNNMTAVKKIIRESIPEDILITQTSSAISELVKCQNLLTKRFREWYSYYLPEIEHQIEDNNVFIKIVQKKTKKELMKEMRRGQSMGREYKEEDINVMLELAKEIQALDKLKESQEDYLATIMKRLAPNMTIITGPIIGAKLITLAGSIKKMVFFPASTIQLLGAEKALFRHMVNKKSLPPKYGVIYQHPIIQKVKKASRGKVARLLADKISLAIKVDYFKGEPIGEKLKQEIEKKAMEMV